MTATLPSAPPMDAPGAPRRRGRIVALVMLAVVVTVALAVLAGRLAGGAVDSETTVDRSTDPDGLRAFVLLLEAFGAEVDQGGIDALAATDPDVVLVLPGVALAPDEVTELVRWGGEGSGRIVDAADVLGTSDVVWVPGAVGGELLRGPGCGVDAFDDVDRIAVGPGDAGLVDSFVESTACFVPVDGGPLDADLPFVVVPTGSGGRWVAMGGVSPFTNRLLDQEDNAVLATSLFAPRPGTRVLLLRAAGRSLPTAEGVADGVGSGGDPGRGDQGSSGSDDEAPPDDDGGDEPDEDTLADLIPTGVTFGLLQLLVAFGLYAWWRGRRVGAPVREPQPVDIEGSELVAAVGDLLARTGSPERAGERLRAEAARQLASRLGLPADVAAAQLAEAVAARTGRPADVVLDVLDGSPTRDGDALAALAARLDALREEVLDGVRA